MKGQTLIEVLVAMSIAAIVISAVTTTVLQSLGSTQAARNESQAEQFAQEGMEIARQYAKTTANGSYCLDQGATALTTGTCASPNLNPNYVSQPSGVKTMIRTVVLANTCPVPPGGTAALTRVTVSVNWADGHCLNTAYCHKAVEETCL
jgi:prepilin-type N-terminal cleavage/methylation domain-containing protein